MEARRHETRLSKEIYLVNKKSKCHHFLMEDSIDEPHENFSPQRSGFAPGPVALGQVFPCH
jgi:hypothetical protein